ncbi:MAG: nucleotidyltransferase family protein [Deltaproteobacteria bacterium]|nr:nucleotidyltransferase family protein [Deltaproteobacteria bacterium]
MSRFVVIIESYFNNLIEKKFEFKKEYNANASQIIERLVWHKSIALAAALFWEYGEHEHGRLENYLKQFSIEHTVNEEFYYHKSLQLYNLFVDNKIPFYPLKGPFWASIIYPDPKWRHIGDLDLIVPLDKSKIIYDILTSLNMKPITEPDTNRNNIEEYLAKRGELAFSIKRPKEFIVEIHGVLVTSTRYRKSYAIDLQPLWNSNRFHSWRDIKFPVPPLEEWILYLVLHGACQHQFKRFLTILDITHFLDIYREDLDWDKIVELAYQWRVDKALYHSLKVVNMFKSPEYDIPAQLKTTNLGVRLQTSLLQKKTILLATKKHGRFSRKVFRTGIT